MTNVLLDLVFVYGCSLGMIGNAIGSVLALILNLIIYGYLFQRKGLLTVRKVKWERIGVILWGSIPMMIQEFLESTVFVVVIGALISRIGLQEMAV